MTELWLRYTDENGKEKRLPVKQEKFAIGRHSENDLSIANSAISRQHLKIERFADIFVVSDVGSSLGTKINGQDLTDPVALKKGDRLKLGDSLELEIELISDDETAGNSTNAGAGSDKSDKEKNDAGSSSSVSASAASAAASSGKGSSFPTSIFYIAPLLGFIVLLSLGGIFLATSGGSREKEISQNNDFIYTDERRNSADPTPDTDKIFAEKTPLPSQTNENSTLSTTETPAPSTPEETNPQTKPQISGELAKIEVNSMSFLRRIAQSQQGAFLTGKQQEILQTKINQFKNSPALADNLKSAKRNEAAIKSLASSKNIKPQLLTTAALARLGNNRGDVLQTAQSMAEVLDDLSRNIGDERPDDVLIIVAAYEQGAAGDTLKMRNMLQNLNNEFPGSSRQMRSIWFLKEKGKLTDSQFEDALRFLAIGTISQNPKDFGVNAEAVSF